MFFTQNLSLFKNQFRHLIFYSMPSSILLVFRKRLNFLALCLLAITLIFYTIV